MARRIDWRPAAGAMPRDVRRHTRVDVMRVSGAVETDNPAAIWNWAATTIYGPLADPIAAYRHTPQPGAVHPLRAR